MARVLIVEDEPIIALDIKQTLTDVGHVVVGVVDNGYEALGLLSEKLVDLALLDITLRGTIDGVELGIKIRQKFKIAIVYVTSHFDDETIGRLTGVYPEALIIKPFLPTQLVANVSLALTKNRVIPIDKDKVMIRQGQGLIPIDTTQIIYLQAESNYTALHMQDGTVFTLAQTLSQIGKKLDERQFLRIHKSYIVQAGHINSISHASIYVWGNQRLPIGKTYTKQLWDKLQKL